MQLAIYTSRQSGATGELGTLAGELETRVRQQAEIENNRTLMRRARLTASRRQFSDVCSN